MIVEARPAQRSDLAMIAMVAESVVVEFDAEKGGELWRRQRDAGTSSIGRLEDMMGDERARLVVGTIDDVVFGYGLARWRALTDKTRLGEVVELVVESGARGVGIGRLLLDDLVAWCDAQGCLGVDSVALPGARETKNFFEAAHFTARAIIVHHRLGSAPLKLQA